MVASLLPAIANATDLATSCGALVTDQECKAYIESLGNATSDTERRMLEKEHAAILKERARFCHEQPDRTGDTEARPIRAATPPARKIWM